MNKGVFVAIVLVAVVLAVALVWVWSRPVQTGSLSGNTGTVGLAPSSTGTNFDQTISTGAFSFSYPSSTFGLATTKEQILVRPNIPPCSEGFDYCVYYIGSAYRGTNFESAGLRIEKRADLKSQTACLTAQPSGYTGLVPKTAASSDYAVGVFGSLGNAAAGHFANGSLYRLYYKNSCYEFETRIGQSDYGNYPPGAIKQFTSADQAQVQGGLQAILDTLTLTSGEKVVFPK